ncbi:MAG: AMP-binding protein [Oscillospiraceae bacterium]
MNIFQTIFENNCSQLDKVALSITMNNGDKRSYTYGLMFDTIERYASILKDAGLCEGDRIAFISEGCPEWPIAFFASAKIKCTSVLIDSTLQGTELREYIERSDVRCAYFSPKVFEKIPNSSKYDFPVLNILTGAAFDGCLDKIPSSKEKTIDPDSEIAAIIFSSGTTKKASGIMHTHDALIETTKMTLEVQGLTRDGRYLAIIPNSHIYGVICLVLGPHIIGGDVHYVESISAEAILGAFAEYHPSVLPAVPKVYELFMTQVMRKIKSNPATATMFKTFFPICLKLRKKNGNMLGKKLFKSIHEGFGGSLDVLCSAGSPMNKDVAEFYYGVGFNILTTYGASETNIPTIGNTKENMTTDTCGRPYPAINLKISDTGEILIKSPFMMKGYFRDEAATKAAFDSDGWFLSGDLGEIDEHGNIKVTGRCKENIVLSTGKKLTPDDVESKYTTLSGVKEFVICGVPAYEADYDEIHAFVVPENNTAEALEAIKKEIIQKGTEVIQNMRVAKTHFVNEIPRTSLQKPKRYLLKLQALAERTDNDETDEKSLKVDTLGQVIDIVTKIANAENGSVTENTKIFSELSIDSLSAMNLALSLEDKFKVNIEKYYNEEMTIADIVLALEGKGKEKKLAVSDSSYPLDKNGKDYFVYKTFKGLVNTIYNIEVKNADYLPTHCGYIMAANHVSYIDLLIVSTALSKEQFLKFCCMGKKEIFTNSFLSKELVKVSGLVPVDRGGINVQTMSELSERLKDGWCVGIHPEGTRSDDGVFRHAKSGAAKLAVDNDVPIIPVYISGMYEVYPKGKKVMKFFDWQKFKRYNITVTFGKPLSSKNISVDELNQKLENSITELQESNVKVAITK